MHISAKISVTIVAARDILVNKFQQFCNILVWWWMRKYWSVWLVSNFESFVILHGTAFSLRFCMDFILFLLVFFSLLRLTMLNSKFFRTTFVYEINVSAKNVKLIDWNNGMVACLKCFDLVTFIKTTDEFAFWNIVWHWVNLGSFLYIGDVTTLTELFPICSLTSLQKGCAMFAILKGTFLFPPSIFGCTKTIFFDGAIDGN